MGSRKRILIIEDDEQMRSLLSEVIEEEGYAADAVEKATYALKKSLTESFALIITDVRMPSFSGLDLLPELRRLQPGTPILVITAFGSAEVHCRAIEKGAVAYMEKPVRLSELRNLIQHMVFPVQERDSLEHEVS
jgi:DNA-binding NtrC family response regulator